MRRKKNFSEDRNRRTIYAPLPEDPSSLPPGVRADWDRAYTHALKIFGAKDTDTAGLSAWRYIKMHYYPTEDGGWDRRDLSGWGGWDFFEAPMEGEDLVILGRHKDICVYTPDGAPLRHISSRDEAQGEDLLIACWLRDRRQYWAIPPEFFTRSTLKPSKLNNTDVYQKWSNRAPKEVFTAKIPKSIKLKELGMGDTISYRSDKWGDRNPDPNLAGSQEYYHPHSTAGVRVFGDSLEKPQMLIIFGGQLDLHSKGLIH